MAGDCRDCAYYSSFHLIGKDEYKCDYSGEYFSDEYGEQCHCFYSNSDKQKAEDVERIKREENDFIFYDWLLGGKTFSSDNDNANNSSGNQYNRDGFSKLILLPIYVVLYFFIEKSTLLINNFDTSLGCFFRIFSFFAFTFIVVFTFLFSFNEPFKQQLKTSLCTSIVLYILFLLYVYW